MSRMGIFVLMLVVSMCVAGMGISWNVIIKTNDRRTHECTQHLEPGTHQIDVIKLCGFPISKKELTIAREQVQRWYYPNGLSIDLDGESRLYSFEY